MILFHQFWVEELEEFLGISTNELFLHTQEEVVKGQDLASLCFPCCLQHPWTEEGQVAFFIQGAAVAVSESYHPGQHVSEGLHSSVHVLVTGFYQTHPGCK